MSSYRCLLSKENEEMQRRVKERVEAASAELQCKAKAIADASSTKKMQ